MFILLRFHHCRLQATDARTAMDLALLKISRGPAFGVSTGEKNGERLMDVLGAHRRWGLQGFVLISEGPRV